MLIQKITSGFCTQVFDTEKGVFVQQYFTAGDEVDYETDGDPTPEEEKMVEENYLPFEMKQPEEL